MTYNLKTMCGGAAYARPSRVAQELTEAGRAANAEMVRRWARNGRLSYRVLNHAMWIELPETFEPPPNARLSRQRISDELAARLRLDYQSGVTIKALSEREGLPIQYLKRLMTGEACPRAPGPIERRQRQHKLTQSQRWEIWRRANNGESVASLAREYGVSASHVYRIRRQEPPNMPHLSSKP